MLDKEILKFSLSSIQSEEAWSRLVELVRSQEEVFKEWVALMKRMPSSPIEIILALSESSGIKVDIPKAQEYLEWHKENFKSWRPNIENDPNISYDEWYSKFLS